MSALYEKDESFGESQQLDFHPDSMTAWLCDLKQIKVFPWACFAIHQIQILISTLKLVEDAIK